MRKVVGIIPARFASSRLPGKVLIKIKGKAIIQYVYERAKKAQLLDEVWVATDDKRIEETVEGFGGKAISTSTACLSGTERVAEAAKKIKAEFVINIQGDEPLIPPRLIDEVVEILLEDPKVKMATLRTKILKEEEINNPNVVKVVVDKNDFALYFSRSPIPFFRDPQNKEEKIFYKHLGIYGYRREFLLKIPFLKETFLEKAEKLEQLRILEGGFKIKVKETKFTSLGLDTREDLEKIKPLLENISSH
jgi:3-deoxy-manno-octulosonate cytidylyltransferase (CMP-KDO synthetase)